SGTSAGNYMAMTPEKLNQMLSDGQTKTDGKTHFERLNEFTSGLSPEVKTRYNAAVSVAMKGLDDLSTTLPVSTLARFGLVFGALGFIAAGQTSAQALEAGDKDKAQQIMRDWAAETAASEIAGKIAGTIALIGVGVAAAAGVAISAPLAGALILGATLVGGFFGGEAAKDLLAYL